MSREIKFRAWVVSKATNTAWMNYEIEFIGGKINDIFASGVSSFAEITYLQYTGLKNKNGREIYEGDIYSYTMTIDGSHWNEHKVEYSEVVKFVDGAFYHGVHLLSDVIDHDETFTYVGNIYEHPHLLEVQR